MSVAALIIWFCTAAFGLILLTIWLIEYDRDFQRVAATRLPVPVIFLHALLAIAGLVVWVIYLIVDTGRLAWASVIILGTVALLGLTMAGRWVPVYRSAAAAKRRAAAGASPQQAEIILPPERNFPLSVVIGHGILAVTTVVVVLLTALGISAA